MTTIAKTSLIIFCIAIMLTIFVMALIFWLEGRQMSVGRIEYYKLYFDAIKAIWISFLVALFVALIPQGIGEVRYRFERLKESRIAYSEAKTGMDYLTLRLCTLPLKEAAALVQQVHVWKHQAELYDELEQWLERRYKAGDERRDPMKWGDQIYYKLLDIHLLLEKQAASWDTLTPDARLKLLLEVQPTMKETQEIDNQPT